MKTILLIAALVSLTLLPGRAAEDADRTKLAEELLSTMRLENAFKSGWTAYPPVEGVAPQVDPPEVARATWQKLKPGYVKAYAEVYTAHELRALIAFFKSPIGQVYLDKMPEIERRVIPLQGILLPEPAKPK